ncbi:MAG: cysteine desulfurase NifS [Candidatus Ozemobacteraceae bacterium]
MMQVYLDNNATCVVAPEVIEAMQPFFSTLYGNASSMHSFGGQVAKHIEKARADVAALLNCAPEEIIFTSCGTESDNHAIRGIFDAFPEKKHFVTTKVEHPAVLSVGKYLIEKGYRVTELKVDKQGNIDLNELKAAISPDSGLVSIMFANNETGTIFPIEEIGTICREKGVLFHTDAVQAAGKIPLDLKKLPVDLLSISGHKLHAPKGIGVLYVRRGTRLHPFIIGGHQERHRRAGTENVPYIVGLGRACRLAVDAMFEENNRVRFLRDKLEKGLMSTIPFSYLNGNPLWRLPNTSNIGFEFIEGEAILLHLSAVGIAASSGSACTSGSLEPSHVLMAMGVPFSYAHGSTRFSLSRYTTEEEVDYVLKVLPGIVANLRDMSPFYTKEVREKAKVFFAGA